MRIPTKALVIGLGVFAGAATTAHAQYYSHYNPAYPYYWTTPYRYSWANVPYAYPLGQRSLRTVLDGALVALQL